MTNSQVVAILFGLAALVIAVERVARAIEGVTEELKKRGRE